MMKVNEVLANQFQRKMVKALHPGKFKIKAVFKILVVLIIVFFSFRCTQSNHHH